MLETLLKKRSELNDTVALIESETNVEKRFSDLERESDSVARSLKSLGIRRGDRVATLVNRPIFHIESVLRPEKGRRKPRPAQLRLEEGEPASPDPGDQAEARLR